MDIEKPSNYETFKAQVIADLETDDHGVYEVFWLANGWYPTTPVSYRLAVAETVVTELLAENRVVLVQAPWLDATEREPVQNAEEALRAWATWVPEDPVVWMTKPE